MESKATNKLIAQTDITCEFLMAFLRKHKKLHYTRICEHIEIEPNILDAKINILKIAGLISNHTECDENNNIVDRIFSLTPDGEKALLEIGYEFN